MAKHAVLHDVTIKIPAGCNCALVGHSGAGKSTFAKLIPRFYDVRAGRSRSTAWTCATCARPTCAGTSPLSPNIPVLFDLSLLENIRLGRPGASDAEVMEAARRAHADGFIRDFADGYETLAGDRGDRLSGGQKQRLALARAFLKNAPVLLLDEAISALDSRKRARHPCRTGRPDQRTHRAHHRAPAQHHPQFRAHPGL